MVSIMLWKSIQIIMYKFIIKYINIYYSSLKKLRCFQAEVRSSMLEAKIKTKSNLNTLK